MRKDTPLTKPPGMRTPATLRLGCSVAAGSTRHRRTNKGSQPGVQRARAGTILVPIDFSEVAYKAVDYALWMAATLHSSVTLMHVVERAYGEGFLDANQRIQNRKNARLEARVKLNTLATAKWIVGVPVKCVVRDGLPEHEILRAAQELTPHLLILGRKDRNLLSRLIFGSVTADVLDAAPCPVLVIRDSGSFSSSISEQIRPMSESKMPTSSLPPAGKGP